ncbi:MAG: PAS domain S-box protein [Desulfobacteraceae bacterium]|nr:PAS domain S-box protein [Desulfobacteraceae bacterium]
MQKTQNIKNIILEHKRVKQQLHKERKKSRTLSLQSDYSQAMLEASAEGAFIMTKTFVECNSKACQIWKTKKEEIIGKTPADFAPLYQPNGEKSHDMANRKIQSALLGNPQHFFWKDKLPDGSIIDTEVFLKPVTIDGKQHVAASIRDVTKEKLKEKNKSDLIKKMAFMLEKREKAIKEEQTTRYLLEKELELVDIELQEIFEASEDGLVLTDTNKNILKINSAYSRLTGISGPKFIQQKCYDVFPCKVCENGTNCRMDQLLHNNGKLEFETECINDKRQIVPCIVSAITLKDSSGQWLGTIQSFKDLSSYKSGVDRLKASEEMHRVILSSITDAVFITNDEGNFFFISPSVKNIFGYDLEEIWWMDNIEKLLGEHFFSLEQLDKNREIKNIEIAIRDKSGLEHFIDVTVKRVNISGGTILISCHDITQEKIRTRQLEQAGKMVTLGILVSGMGHEINNPNQYIGLNTPLLARVWKDVEKLLDKEYEINGDFFLGGVKYSLARNKIPGLFEGIIQGSRRIKSIVADLKNYSRQDASGQDNKVYINSVVKHSLTLLANQIKKSTNNFKVDYSSQKPMIKGNFQQIEQVIINLVQNACEALTQKNQSLKIIIDIDKKTRSVLIEIKDQGQGIKAEDIDHITDPFFTTKRSCGGTGLGLSISEKIITEHRGKLIFLSEPDRGTRMKVLLPLLKSNKRENKN